MLIFLITFMVLIVTSDSEKLFCAKKSLCSHMPESRIIDSEVAERNSRPFQVALYSRVGLNGALGFCGGVLVAPQWVLTAAHCCLHDGELVDHVQAVVGAHSLYDRYEDNRRVILVDQVLLHPQWNTQTLYADIALLRLANEVQLSGKNNLLVHFSNLICLSSKPMDRWKDYDIDTINTVTLPYANISSFNFAGQATIISGWGIAAEGVTFISPTLRDKVMTVLTDDVCNTRYENLLPADTICASHQTAGTCKGDNGGPMTVYHTQTEATLLIGVASFINESGCNINIPSVFTRLSSYLDWISEITGIDLL